MCIGTVLMHIFSHLVSASYNEELKTSSDTQLAVGSGELPNCVFYPSSQQYHPGQ